MTHSTPRPLSQWILAHNPLYLLSAALMLLGCFLLSSALDIAAGEIGKLLLLLGTLNAYEFLLVGLGLWLWRSRKIVRDGTILLLLEALFLADLTFLNSEAAAAGLRLGIAVNGALLLLALAKLALITWILPLEKSPRSLGFVALLLAMLCGLPLLLRCVSHDGIVGPRPFYLLWWIVGLTPVVYDLLCRLWDQARRQAVDPARQIVRRGWTVLPWLSLVAHLGFQHWVYRADFYAVELVPVLLGLLVIVPRLPAWTYGNSIVGARIVLAVAAFSLGLTNPADLGLAVIGTTVPFSPLMAAFSGMVLSLAYCSGWRDLGLAALFVLTLDSLRLWGPSLDTLWNHLVRPWHFFTWLAGKLTPTTPAQWGIVAVAGAFLALAAGAVISLRKPSPHPDQTP